MNQPALAANQRKEETFSAMPIVIRNINANIFTEIIAGDKVSVIIEGGIDGVNKAKVIPSDGIILVEGADTAPSGDVPPIQITVRLPAFTKFGLSDVRGLIQIGDTLGDIEINANTDGNYKIGKVGNTVLSLNKNNDVSIQEVNGDLKIFHRGSGNVNISGGKVSLLFVHVFGSGSVRFGGYAEVANLGSLGSGEISVHFVKDRPMINESGTGQINVYNW